MYVSEAKSGTSAAHEWLVILLQDQLVAVILDNSPVIGSTGKKPEENDVFVSEILLAQTAALEISASEAAAAPEIFVPEAAAAPEIFVPEVPPPDLSAYTDWITASFCQKSIAVIYTHLTCFQEKNETEKASRQIISVPHECVRFALEWSAWKNGFGGISTLSDNHCPDYTKVRIANTSRLQQEDCLEEKERTSRQQKRQ